MPSELEAIVRELADSDPIYFDQYERRRCTHCGRQITVYAPISSHDPNCRYIRAQQAVDHLDAATQPATDHVRFFRALNMKARENPGNGCTKQDH